ncbi:hypothetical protein P9112_004905 [Eukaryota sp. TZLM1-RC]
MIIPVDDIPKPLNRNKVWQRAPKLRHPIVPGSVLILLAGRFRGKRVVFLKQMESGLLLVTGPYKVNGVPLRRINQAFVMPTSTKVELPAINLDKYTDDYFKKGDLDAGRIEDQKQVDAQVLGAVKEVPFLKDYLRCAFTLNNGDHPHRLRF